MTSTPTPEPGERVWRCLLDGSCTATSTDDIGYHVACGWVTLPAPSTPGEGAGRPRPDTAKLRDAADWWTTWLEKPKHSSDHGWGDAIRAAADWIDAQPPASPVPPTPTPCPYIVTGGEGTSYCSLAERSAMHAAAPPSTPADPHPTDPTGSEA